MTNNNAKSHSNSSPEVKDKKPDISSTTAVPTIDIDYCSTDMSFADCELAVVRHAIDESSEMQKKSAITPEIKDMVSIVEEFIKRKKLVCYGGTAINNILPTHAQFYDREAEIPDYDFFSDSPLADAKELADIYFSKGYKETEAKSGIHHGTFKVFVNYTPIADITLIHNDLFKRLQKDAIIVNDIRYCPVNYLRMNMHLELSRPAGDVSRWDKVAKRLSLLDEHFPMSELSGCAHIKSTNKNSFIDMVKICEIVKMELIEQEVVFFGGYAASLYSEYMPNSEKDIINVVNFDVIHDNPSKCAQIIKDRLTSADSPKVSIITHAEIGEMLPKCVEITVAGRSVAIIYEPIACHNYNNIEVGGKTVRIATIDTMMTFYLALYYSNKSPEYNNRILCMAKLMFDISKKYLNDNGILKRFSVLCYGTQSTLQSVRAIKTNMRRTIKRGSPEYDEWFLNYSPHNISISDKVSESNTDKIVESKRDTDDVSKLETNINKITYNKSSRRKTYRAPKHKSKRRRYSRKDNSSEYFYGGVKKTRRRYRRKRIFR